MGKKKILFYFFTYGIFILVLVNYEYVNNLIKNTFQKTGSENVKKNEGPSYYKIEREYISEPIKYGTSQNEKNSIRFLDIFPIIQKYVKNFYEFLIKDIQWDEWHKHREPNNDPYCMHDMKYVYQNNCILPYPKYYTMNDFKINTARKLSIREDTHELKPYVTRGQKNETVVNLHEYFVKEDEVKLKSPEIFITPKEQLHRVVIICSKPSIHYSHVITRPSTAMQDILDDNQEIISTDSSYPVIFYPEINNWGLDNKLSTGMVEFLIPPYSAKTNDLIITCANIDANDSYKFEDFVIIRIRVHKTYNKILGVSTDKNDKPYFEEIISDEKDTYEFEGYLEKVVGIKLEGYELDPPNCFKSVYEDDKRIYLEVEFHYSKCINLDRKNYKLRFFFLSQDFADYEYKFSCNIINIQTQKKKTITFGDGMGTSDYRLKIVDDDSQTIKYFNDIPYQICNFDYNLSTKGEIQICEKTINEFSLFMYNCEEIQDKQVVYGQEPANTIKYLNNVFHISNFTDLFFNTKDIDIPEINQQFKGFKFLMTSFINHGSYPLTIECGVTDGSTSYKKATILLHVRTDLKDRPVSFCDFRKGKLYNYLNAYTEGDSCKIIAKSNTSFGFRCPENTKKMPEKCFMEVYEKGYPNNANKMNTQNIITYSFENPEYALAGFNYTLTKPYQFECHCVDNETEKIVKTVLVKYVNEDEIYDYNDLPMVNHKSNIVHPYKTHLCDFATPDNILSPVTENPVNYVCNVFPKPLEYVALHCPTNLVDVENENEISKLSKEMHKEEIKAELRIRLRKRNIYSMLYHIPKNAPSYVIDKNMQSVSSIEDIIPGVIVSDHVIEQISKMEKNEHGIYDASITPNENDETNILFKKYVGKDNSISNGFFIFQLPPHIETNETLEFLCINSNTKKNLNIGNNGIMTVHVRKGGTKIDGCYFYKNVPQNSFLKESIKMGSNVECKFESDGSLEYFGIQCPAQNGLFLSPNNCFSQMYTESNELVNIKNVDPDFEVFSDNKGLSYLKISQTYLGYSKLTCYCNDKDIVSNIDGTPLTQQNKITIEFNISNKNNSGIQKTNYADVSNFLVGYEFLNKKATPIYRKKHICDFTKKSNSLEPVDEKDIIDSCYIHLEQNLNMVQVKCPKIIKNDDDIFDINTTIDTNLRSRSSHQNNLHLENRNIEPEELEKYKNIEYIPENDEVMHLDKKEKLEDILPGVIILDKNKMFKEKGHFSFVTPLIVENLLILKIYCDNSKTIIDNKKGKKGITVIRVSQNTTKNKFYGCDFSGNPKKTFYYSHVYDLEKQNEFCEIELKEDIVVSLNCPTGKINPKNCFRNVYIKSNMDEETTENIENIFNEIKVIDADYFINNSSTFLIISKITKKEFDFYCTCENYKTQNVGTIYIKNYEYLGSKPKYKNKQVSYIDVVPYYLNDTYVCDFTEHHYSILQRKNINIEEILKRYLQMVKKYEHEEYNHYNLNLKLKKEIMKKQYIEYLKQKIKEFEENPFNITKYVNQLISFRCNIDLNPFDKFVIKCPPKNRGNTDVNSQDYFDSTNTIIDGVKFENFTYRSNLGLNENKMVEKLNKVLFGSLLINKNKKSSFFEQGSLELIISPYSESSKNIVFSCEYLEKDESKRIMGTASIFIKKNDKKILGCHFIDKSFDVNSLEETNKHLTSMAYKNNSFVFEVDLIEGKTVYCDIEAIENDVVGLSCPYNFITTPENCFEYVQIEGTDKELETHKLDNLLYGVKIFKNEMYKHNYTPTYIILPKRINKSHKIFCSCNSINSIQVGIIQINIIGEDLNNWFKKEVTHNIYAYQRQHYFYDFSSGDLSITSENENPILILSDKTYESSKQSDAVVDESPQLNRLRLSSQEGSASVEKYKSNDPIGQEEYDDGNILNPLRTKKVYEITVTASEFSTIKIVCPLRNNDQFKQSKISPENFFEYVLVKNKEMGARTNLSLLNLERFDKMIIEKFKGINKKSKLEEEKNKKGISNKEDDDIDEEEEEDEKTSDIIKEEIKKVEYDNLGNKIIISIKSKKPKATIEDADKAYINQKINESEKYIVKNINDVISYVNYISEINENTYSSTIYFSPLLLNKAQFFITCDNSLTLNQSRRGKTATVKINVQPNSLKIMGCDFVGAYSSYFVFSKKWDQLQSNYVCEINVEDDSIVGLACPHNTKMYPSDCFESVIKNNKIYKRNALIEYKNTFLYQKNGKPTLSFIQIKKVYSDSFTCKCFENNNGNYKEVTIKLIYKSYILGTPKMTINKPFIKYKNMNFLNYLIGKKF
ncbi:6-cysteine protein [Plasmodium chabaudi adami]|uniref:6-cysteine protein n=1 Tax=Plasmodium chabaudi adami TaxID=5826 RepID=A0A1C6X9Y5_PLACE|nr:6-cysteine protein [Plasmodium chabaudi adami]